MKVVLNAQGLVYFLYLFVYIRGVRGRSRKSEKEKEGEREGQERVRSGGGGDCNEILTKMNEKYKDLSKKKTAKSHKHERYFIS